MPKLVEVLGQGLSANSTRYLTSSSSQGRTFIVPDIMELDRWSTGKHKKKTNEKHSNWNGHNDEQKPMKCINLHQKKMTRERIRIKAKRQPNKIRKKSWQQRLKYQGIVPKNDDTISKFYYFQTISKVLKNPPTMLLCVKEEENQIEAALTVRSPPGDL